MYLQPGLYIVIEQLNSPHAPRPLPLESGFSTDKAYLVLGAFSMAESAEMFFILSNDRNETWLISNRHARTYKMMPGATEMRIDLNTAPTKAAATTFSRTPTRPTELAVTA